MIDVRIEKERKVEVRYYEEDVDHKEEEGLKPCGCDGYVYLDNMGAHVMVWLRFQPTKLNLKHTSFSITLFFFFFILHYYIHHTYFEIDTQLHIFNFD